MSDIAEIDEETLKEFIGECQDMAERVVVSLSKSHSGFSKDQIDSFYRDVHTIKGSAQLFGFKKIGLMSQCMEACLDPVRNGIISLNDSFIDLILKGLDFVSRNLDSIETNKHELTSENELLDIIPSLSFLCSSTLTQSTFINKDIYNYGQPSAAELKDAIASLHPTGKLVNNRPESIPGLHIFSEEEITQKTEPDSSKKAELKPIKEEAKLNNESNPKPSKPDSKPEETKSNETKSAPSTQLESSTIRVPVSLLDDLMNHIGEMVLVRNQVLQYSKKSEDSDFQNLSQRLNVITSELQVDVMKTRMQPIGNILNKFNRVVRDISRSLGKKVDISIHGADTELDKTLIEAVKDPLTHIIRNCVDHGIELPEERLKDYKSEIGHIQIRAYHEGGQIIINIEDDGRGLDPEKISKKAVEKGLIDLGVAQKLSDPEIFQLIFSPGFSTAAKVSDISGRGVGMDVVKTNIENIGGVVELNSRVGKGTSISIKIPLTLAIVPAIIVKSAGNFFAIPQVKVLELIKIETNKIDGNTNQSLVFLQGKPFIHLRGQLLPLLVLSEVLGFGTFEEEDLENNKLYENDINIAVVNADGGPFGLLINEIEDSADIVVKPLPLFLKKLSVYSGATILGDGNVILILDVIGLSADMIGEERNKTQDLRKNNKHENSLTDRSDYLLVDLESDSKYALPLCLVSRLEVMEASKIEYSGSNMVLNYRGNVIPILVLPKLIEENSTFEIKNLEDLKMIIIDRSNISVGLVVSDILDVQQIEENIDYTFSDKKGILGNIINNDTLYNILDIYTIIDNFIKRESISAQVATKTPEVDVGNINTEQRKQKVVLVVDDFTFFRDHVSKVLSDSGYKVIKASHGKEALALLDDDQNNIDALLSDIEMPHMTGLELIEKVRANNKTSVLPAAALTTKYSKKDIEKGKALGFDLYLEKLKADILVKQMDYLIFEIRSHQKAA